jgi:hypothetical protein
MQLIKQDQAYRSFTIKYGLCIYPRSSVKHTIKLGERDDADNNYKNITEFNESYVLPESHNPSDNYLDVLHSRLSQEKFEPNKVNIIVLFSNEAAKTEVFNEKLKETAELLAKNRCHLLAINIKGDPKFDEQIRKLSLRANQEFNRQTGGNASPGTFETSEGITYLYDYLLSFIVSVKDLKSEAVVEGWKFSSKKLLTTIQNLQSEICGAPQSSEGIQIQRNDNFTKTYGLKGKKSVTFMMEGWIANKYNEAQQEFTWAPEVLFNETELDRMVSIMNRYYDNNKSANELADALYETYLELFNSFVGEKLTEKEIRDLTPSHIMSKIVGGTFGLDLTNDFKKLTLGEIRSNSENTQKVIKAYENNFKQSVARLSSVRQDTKLRFTLDSEKNTTGVYYYWVPMSYLP